MSEFSSVVAYIVRHMFIGVGFGALFATGALWFDVAGLGSLIMASNDRVVALSLLYGGFAVTFGSVVCGTAIMMISDADEFSGRGG